jgi:hypothetical protein
VHISAISRELCLRKGLSSIPLWGLLAHHFFGLIDWGSQASAPLDKSTNSSGTT